MMYIICNFNIKQFFNKFNNIPKYVYIIISIIIMMVLFEIAYVILHPKVIPKLQNSKNSSGKILGHLLAKKNSIESLSHIFLFLMLLLIFIDCEKDIGMAAWFSGFGTFTAAFIALESSAKRPPNITLSCERYFNQYFVIQLINDSNTSDFIRLYGIYHSEQPNINFKKMLKDKRMIPDIKLRKYIQFVPLKAHDVINIHISLSSIKYMNNRYHLDNYKYLVFIFTDTYRRQLYPIFVSKKQRSKF